MAPWGGYAAYASRRRLTHPTSNPRRAVAAAAVEVGDALMAAPPQSRPYFDHARGREAACRAHVDPMCIARGVAPVRERGRGRRDEQCENDGRLCFGDHRNSPCDRDISVHAEKT